MGQAGRRAAATEGEEQAMERAESTGGTDEARLMALLRDLVEEVGPGKAAAQLGIDRKTLWRTLNSRTLTPRLTEVLERRLVAGERADAVRQRQRLAALEQRVEGLENTVSTGLDAVRGEVGALAEAHTRAVRQLERAPAVERAPQGARETAGNAVRGPSPPAVKGGPEPTIGERPASSGKATAWRPPRPYPQLVTLEREEGEELVYGEAAPLIVEWRRVRDECFQNKGGVAGTAACVRMRELEIALIGEHELTLPPAQYPWDQFERRDQVWRRTGYLADVRAVHRWALLQRGLRLSLTPALLLGVAAFMLVLAA